MCSLDKSSFKNKITIQDLRDMMYDPNRRANWDENVKSMNIVEGDYPNSYIIKTWMKSPVFFISERDILDKRIEFWYNGVYYCFGNSIDEQFVPLEDGVVRCKILINGLIITESDDKFYILNFSQLDAKMILPEYFFNFLLPYKVKTFYKTLVEDLNKRDV